MDFYCDQDQNVASSDKKKKVKFVLNGNPTLVSSSQTVRDSFRIIDIIDIGCRALNIRFSNPQESEQVRIFRSGGVELFEEDVKYLKSNEILYVSPQLQDFDESNNFAMYKLLAKIGKGGYGHVYEAKHRLTKQRLAIKLIQGQTVKTAKDTEMIFKEIGMLNNLHCKHIVKVFNCYTLKSEMKVAVVLEYLEGGDLREYLDKQPGQFLEEEQAKRIFKQLQSAMSYCHREKIIHRDLKLENIMFVNRISDDIKVVDFGISGTQNLINIDYTEAGSARYFAPEVLSTHAPAHPAIDVWAMGCILFWMLVGQSPFPQPTKEEVFSHILKCDYAFPAEAKSRLTRASMQLIQRMLQLDPLKRITMVEIAQHPWLKCPLTQIRELEKEENEISETLENSCVSEDILVKSNGVINSSQPQQTNKFQRKQETHLSLKGLPGKRRQSIHFQGSQALIELNELRLQVQREELSAKEQEEQRKILAQQRRSLVNRLPAIALNQLLPFSMRKSLFPVNSSTKIKLPGNQKSEKYQSKQSQQQSQENNSNFKNTSSEQDKPILHQQQQQHSQSPLLSIKKSATKIPLNQINNNNNTIPLQHFISPQFPLTTMNNKTNNNNNNENINTLFNSTSSSYYPITATNKTSNTILTTKKAGMSTAMNFFSSNNNIQKHNNSGSAQQQNQLQSIHSPSSSSKKSDKHSPFVKELPSLIRELSAKQMQQRDQQQQIICSPFVLPREQQQLQQQQPIAFQPGNLPRKQEGNSRQMSWLKCLQSSTNNQSTQATGNGLIGGGILSSAAVINSVDFSNLNNNNNNLNNPNDRVPGMLSQKRTHTHL